MSTSPTPSAPPPDPGLPPVQPPSGRQILQLFVVPALIVGVLVILFLVGPALYKWFGQLAGRSSADTRTAEQFLRDLDNSNPEVRWRAASDLAQVLLRKDELASDVDFAQVLADRLQTTLDDSAAAEKLYAERQGTLSEGDRAKELKKLEPERHLSMFLGASLGNCMVPVGAPLLEQMALQTRGMEADALAERRSRALFALATLGENLKRFDRLDDDRKDAIENKLEEAGSSRARQALAYLRARRQDRADTMGVAAVLATCAGDEDPYLRELAAFAANFWHGTTAEERTIEDFLVTLSNDSGVGADKLEERTSRNPEAKLSRPLTKKKGFNVQANATIALARRGSPRVRLDLLEEMLDPEQLRSIFVIKPKGAAEQPDEALVARTVLDSLKAVALLHHKRPELKLDRLVPLIDRLAKSDNAAVRAEAKQAQLALIPDS